MDTLTVSPYRQARLILGEDLITPLEVREAGQGVYTPKQSQILAESLPSREILEGCRHYRYGAMPAPPRPLSTLGVRTINPYQFYATADAWFGDKDQKFAYQDQTSFGWLLIKKEPVLGSLDRTWEAQTPLLVAGESVPNSAELCWFITTYFAVRRKRLFSNVFVRTSSQDQNDNRVGVGYYDDVGLGVNICQDNARSIVVGLSAIRRLDS